MILDENKVSCCTLIADCIMPSKKEEGYRFSYAYNVPAKQAAEYMNFINETFAYFGQPCSRVYVSGFVLSTRSSVWDKERIVSQVKMITERNNTLINEESNFLHRQK